MTKGNSPRRMKIKISPSILAANFSCLLKDIIKVEKAGADFLHIDVMDGNFVPNITIGQPVIKALRGKCKLPFDVHLMINDPDRYIEDFKNAGSSILTVHVEVCKHLNKTIQHIKNCGMKAGVALNPATPLYLIEDILSEVDIVLIMTVNPGFGGQKFIHNCLNKIKTLRSKIVKNHLNVDIEVDGGINAQTSLEVIKAGANILVAGVAIFHEKDIVKAIQNIRHSI